MTTASMTTTAPTDPHRFAPRVPLVVLPDTGFRVLPWRCPEPAAPHAAAALATLDQLAAAAGESDMRVLRRLLPDGVTALGRLADALTAAGGALATDTMPPTKPIYSYFGVRHSDTMGSTSMTLYAVLIARWTLAELTYAAVDGNQIVALLAGLRTIIAGLGETPLTPRPPAPESTGADPDPQHLRDYLPDGGPQERWVVAHHAYLLFNMLAAGSTEAAVDCLSAGPGFEGRAAEHLRTAAVQTRAFTAAMLWSAVLPDRLYLDVIRPTMAPPNLPKGLTGGAFLEHKHHHYRIKELLARRFGGMPYRELLGDFPDLADARDQLLEADWADIENHMTMGEQAIHHLRSLVQVRPEENAVAWLRRRRLERVELYRPIIRFGAVQA